MIENTTENATNNAINNFGIRAYTTSEKTKRPQKTKLDEAKLQKRNSNQKRLYITLENIDEIFSNNNDKFPVCYDLIFNTIQGKVTKFFNTRNYDRKKELSYDCINYFYSVLKRKLLKKQQEEPKQKPVLFFYLSQFFRYIELVVFSVTVYGTRDQKIMVQQPDEFDTDDVFNEETVEYDEYFVENMDDNIVDNSESIKMAIENNKFLLDKEKNLLFKIYKSAYSPISNYTLNKKDSELLVALQERMKREPELLKDLEVILNGGE